MNPVSRLHPQVRHFITNYLEWPKLRPLQQAAIEPILDGDHCVLLAPTAGGKTEAALLPVFSQLASANRAELTVLYICPIKALLNNLSVRLANYGARLGLTTGLWHGDAPARERKAMTANPPQLLLTTPESLEVMLISQRLEHRAFFGGVKTVIIDEVHAFAGDDRGTHLLALLARLDHLTGLEIQRLGLSATVGNPEALAKWLATGCQRPHRVINPVVNAMSKPAPPEMKLDYVGSLGNAAKVIAMAHPGRKRLVFCDSRMRVEELALELRERGVKTFVSHSSLGTEERHAAESAFSQGDNCVIVATSTLELGIDVGDLDHVIQIDAPHTVASILQRLGRTGRRAGTRANCLFLATSEAALLQSAGLMHLWLEGFVEPISAPPMPYHILAQQWMALTLQERGLPMDQLSVWSGAVFDDLPSPSRKKLLAYMGQTGMLHANQGLVSIAAPGQEQFGKKNFMALFSVFSSPPLFKIMSGNREIGQVHESTFQGDEEGPRSLTLAGRKWQVIDIKWTQRIAWVVPGEERGKSRWLGEGRPLGFHLSRAVAAILSGKQLPAEMLTRRARDFLDGLREDFSWMNGPLPMLFADDQGPAWHTFAGAGFNAAASAWFKQQGFITRHDDFCIRFEEHLNSGVISSALDDFFQDEANCRCMTINPKMVRGLKFNQCLPPDLILEMFRARNDVSPIFRILAQAHRNRPQS